MERSKKSNNDNKKAGTKNNSKSTRIRKNSKIGNERTNEESQDSIGSQCVWMHAYMHACMYVGVYSYLGNGNGARCICV